PGLVVDLIRARTHDASATGGLNRSCGGRCIEGRLRTGGQVAVDELELLVQRELRLLRGRRPVEIAVGRSDDVVQRYALERLRIELRGRDRCIQGLACRGPRVGGRRDDERPEHAKRGSNQILALTHTTPFRWAISLTAPESEGRQPIDLHSLAEPNTANWG